MGLEAIDTQKMDFGPAVAYWGEGGVDTGTYLGRTQGETVVEYGVDTFELQTEEDGVVDEVVTADQLTVTIPLVYTDVDTLAEVIPWAELVEHGTEAGEKKLKVPKAVGKRLSDYADQLQVRPIAMLESVEEGEEMVDDPSRDVTVHKCYPKPGPINLGYARDGTRIANVTFVAIEDENGEYLTIGDEEITGEET